MSMITNKVAGVFTKDPVLDLKSVRVFRVVRTDIVHEDLEDVSKNQFTITVVDGNHKNTVLPCTSEVYLDEGLGRMTNHYIDLYMNKAGVVVATDGYERNDFMNRITPSEDEIKEIVVTISPVTGLSSVRSRPYHVSANDVGVIKRLVDGAKEIRPRMLLGKYEVKEVIDPGSGLRLVLSAPKN